MSLTRDEILERLREICARWKKEELFLSKTAEVFDQGMHDASVSDREDIEELIREADAPSPQGDTAK